MDDRYPHNITTQREIRDVIEGKRLCGISYRPGELAALERRANAIGGPLLKDVLHMLRTQKETSK